MVIKLVAMARVLMMMMMMLVLIGRSEGSLHKVGSRKGWIPNFNYTPWSSHHRFYLGDWLLFVFDKHYYNVLEVNKTSYEVCQDQGFINNVTRGGRDVVQLTEARPYYFLSGGGYCWGGMKVQVNVTGDRPSPAPAPVTSSDLHSNTAAAAAAPFHHHGGVLYFISISLSFVFYCFMLHG
ncbi:Lamin-like protein [Linum grandiflorum]